MHIQIGYLKRDEIEIIRELTHNLNGLKSEAEQIALINKQQVSSEILKCVFNTAVINGYLQTVKTLSKVPRAYTTKDNNDAIQAAAQYGELDVVKYLCTPPNADSSKGNYEALFLAAAGGYVDVVDYLASQPCCNPYNQGIELERKNKIISGFTDLNLQKQLSQYLVQHLVQNRKLGFLFFKCSSMDELGEDIRKKIFTTAFEQDYNSSSFKI